jgi:hypothetical protein
VFQATRDVAFSHFASGETTEERLKHRHMKE